MTDTRLCLLVITSGTSVMASRLVKETQTKIQVIQKFEILKILEFLGRYYKLNTNL